MLIWPSRIFYTIILGNIILLIDPKSIVETNLDKKALEGQ